jgi:hypothetical protein
MQANDMTDKIKYQIKCYYLTCATTRTLCTNADKIGRFVVLLIYVRKYAFANGVMFVVALVKCDSQKSCARFSGLMIESIFESESHDLLACTLLPSLKCQ